MSDHIAFGWKKDSGEVTDRMAMTLVASTSPILNEPSHVAFRGRRLLQGGAGACVSFARIRSMQVLAAIAGIGTDVLASPLWDYYVGRIFEHAGEDPWNAPPVEDNGQFPRVSMAAAAHHGVVAWDDYPYEWQRVNEVPPAMLSAKAFKYRDLRWFRIYETGGESDLGVQRRVIAEVSDCMIRGASPLIGMHVDRAFTQNRGEVVERIDPSQIVGGHMMTVLEVRKDTVLLDNWWAERGDANGFFEMTHACFCSWAVGDILVINGLPSGWKR